MNDGVDRSRALDRFPAVDVVLELVVVDLDPAEVVAVQRDPVHGDDVVERPDDRVLEDRRPRPGRPP